jgi:hypothetical protein
LPDGLAHSKTVGADDFEPDLNTRSFASEARVVPRAGPQLGTGAFLPGATSAIQRLALLITATKASANRRRSVHTSPLLTLILTILYPKTP